MAPATRDAMVKMLSFRPADVTDPNEIGQVMGDGDRPDTLVYLALPRACCRRCCRHWRRLGCALRMFS